MNKDKLFAAAKYLGGFLLIALAAPLILAGLQGLLGIAVAVVVCVIAIFGWPVLIQAAKTGQLFSMKWMARTNPIETKELQLKQKRQQIEDSAAELKTVVTEVAAFIRMIDEMPEDEREPFLPHCERARAGVEKAKLALQDLKRKADAYEEGLKKARRRWAAGQALLRLNKLTGKAADEQMQRILDEEADASVERSLDEGLAALEISTILDEAKALPNNPSPVFDVQVVELKEKVIR